MFTSPVPGRTSERIITLQPAVQTKEDLICVAETSGNRPRSGWSGCCGCLEISIIRQRGCVRSSLRSRPSIGRKCRGGRAACLTEGSRQYRNWSRKYSHYTRVAFFVSTVPGHVRLPPGRHPRSAAWICGCCRSVRCFQLRTTETKCIIEYRLLFKYMLYINIVWIIVI